MGNTHVIIYPLGWVTIILFLVLITLCPYILGLVHGYDARDKEFNNNFDFESTINNQQENGKATRP